MRNNVQFLKPISVGVLIFLTIVNQIHIVASNGAVLNVAVIGAGVSGLASAKYSLAQGYNVTVYEQSDGLGGVWRYTEKTGKDEYGINIHSATYQALRTNSPRQATSYHDFPFPSDAGPFPGHAQVLSYLNAYADHFNVTKHIKLNHYVVRVAPIENGKWEIIVRDLPNNKYETLIYDIVFVANGHFAKPRYPNIPGVEEFKGKMMHSHEYRTPGPFQGENVLVIGGGPSGFDIVAHLSKIANRITFSQHKRENETLEQREKRQSLQPPRTLLQDNVKRFTSTGAEFVDGTHQTFSVIIIATGYQFSFPFLSVDTGITVNKSTVLPLYKDVFNIEYPTMIFIGIVRSVIPTIDLQVRFAMEFISGRKMLPSKAEMLHDMHIQNQEEDLKNVTRLIQELPKYSNQLSDAAGIERIPNVVFRIIIDIFYTLVVAPSEFRDYEYTIIDNNTFTKKKYDGGK